MTAFFRVRRKQKKVFSQNLKLETKFPGTIF